MEQHGPEDPTPRGRGVAHLPHLGVRGLHGPGFPGFGRLILAFVPSREKTSGQRSWRDNVFCCACLPLKYRSFVFFGLGIGFFLLGIFSGQILKSIQSVQLRLHYSLNDPTSPSFGNWSHGQPCLPGSRFLRVYMYNWTQQETGVVEYGPYVYSVGWDYGNFSWSPAGDPDNLTFSSQERLVFCRSYSGGHLHCRHTRPRVLAPPLSTPHNS
jgi:hypothetical protein